MKKKIITLIISIVCVLGLVACAKTQETKPTDGLEYTDKGDYYEVSGIGSATETDIVIPSEYNGKTVTSIGPNAFKDCSSLVSVTIPNTVTSIGLSAFEGCSGLTSITIGNSVESIGIRSFQNCIGLTSIIIPDSVTNIGTKAFYDCKSLVNITISDNVESIGGDVFTNTAYYNTFSNYENGGVLYIGNHLIKAKVVRGDYAIKNGTIAIASGAFQSCYELTSVTIPDSVKTIGIGTFIGCSELVSVTIPKNVESIGENAFNSCENLTIYCEAESQPSDWHERWNNSNCPVVWGYKGEN